MPEGTWEEGNRSPGVPAWSDVIAFGDFLLYAAREEIEPAGETKIVAWSRDTSKVGMEVELRVSNPAVATAQVLTARFEPNEVDGVEAVFLVKGVVDGESTFHARDLDGG